MGATFRKASAQQPRREAENKSEDKKEETLPESYEEVKAGSGYNWKF